ncbi:MAG: ABC transporter ATP-binding protein [Candidatus Omnitrophota bacterium]
MPLLEIKNLTTSYFSDGKELKAVNDVSLSLESGQVLGIVGESGCGKSTLALSMMRLIRPPGKITGGSIMFDGKQILGLDGESMRKLRGSEISMIFQEPLSALNPVLRIGHQICEAIHAHREIDKGEAKKLAIELLEKVQIPEPKARFDAYPHQLSGGMRQRVMIAMAAVLKPKLIIADEPTTALDVTIQAQILNLLKEMIGEFGTSLIIVSHDLGVVSDLADRVAVMYAGRIVECGERGEVFKNPAHPYTRALFDSYIRIDDDRGKINAIEGSVPDLSSLPPGCAFNPRCPIKNDNCVSAEPEIKEIGAGHFIRCGKWSG